MKKTIKYLEHDQVTKLLDTMNIRDHFMFSLIYGFGLRVSELLNLTLDDIDLKNKTIKILPLKRKTSDKQVFPLSDKECKMVQIYLSNRPRTDDNHLIVSKHIEAGKEVYKRMSRINIYKLFKRYCRLSGIDKELAHVHTLRHSFAVTGASNGIDIYTMKKLLRHTNLSSTEDYYDIVDNVRSDRMIGLKNKLNL